MSPPISNLFKVRDIENAGRGVVAVQAIPAGTLILESEAPAFHVIFKTYSKETCAFCFVWDRGRTLPIRDNETARVFCSKACQASWEEEQSEIGLRSWKCLTAWVRTRTRSKSSNVEDLMADGQQPSKEEIGAVWKATEMHAKVLAHHRASTGQPTTKPERKVVLDIHRKMADSIDSDQMSYLLSGVLFRLHYPSRWYEEVMSLALDDRPYKCHRDLQTHCTSFLQLISILPSELLTILTSEFCQSIVQADNHNAFGIRAGGEDGEEYMGYGVYPSASYFNHSCSPNVLKRRVGRKWQFTSAKNIASGEECCITYLGGDEEGLNLLQRQSRLKEVWGFNCNCGRCEREMNV